MADFFNIGKLKDSFSDYLRVKFELFKLDISEYMANILAQVIAYVIILLLFTLVLGFACIGISFYLNDLLDSNYLGFLITAGFFLLILIVVFVFLKSGKLKAVFEEMMANQIKLEKEDLEDEKE